MSLISYAFQCKGLSFDGRVIKSDVTEKVINFIEIYSFQIYSHYIYFYMRIVDNIVYLNNVYSVFNFALVFFSQFNFIKK